MGRPREPGDDLVGRFGLTPMARERVVIALDRVFSAAEMERLRGGFVPEAMEERWVVVADGDTLRAHRSWTGRCVYEVDLAPSGAAWRVASARASRDPELRNGPPDGEDDARELAWILDSLVLGDPE